MGSLLINKRPGSLDIKPASQSAPFRINDFIFLSEGASNSYLIETAEGNILINTGLGVEAPIHKYCFDQINQNQIKYIIYTQGHVDHVGGSGFFKEYNPDAILIAQENILEHQSFDSLTQGGRVLNAYKFFGEMIDLGIIDEIRDHCKGIYNFFHNEEGLNCHRSYGYLVNPAVGKIIADWWNRA